MTLNLKRLPPSEWIVTIEGGSLVISADACADNNVRYFRALSLAELDAAEGCIGVENLEGFHFSVKRADSPSI